MVIDTFEPLTGVIDYLLLCSIIGFDLECGLDPYTNDLYLLAICGQYKNTTRTFVFDIQKMGPELLHELKPVFEHPQILKIAHNATFDWKQLYHHGNIYTAPIYCTMITEQVLQSGLRFSGFGLDDIAERRLGRIMDKSVRNSFIDRAPGIPFTQEEFDYAALDTEVLIPIFNQQRAELVEQKLDHVIDQLESPLIPVTAKLEYYGIAIDAERLHAAKPVVDRIITTAEKHLQDEIIQQGGASELTFTRDGYSAVNVGSPPQKRAAFNLIGIDVVSLGKKELSDWDAQWAQKNAKYSAASGDEDDDLDVGYAHPVLHYNAIVTAAAKLQGTYIEGLAARVNPITKRIHGGYKQCGASATGRMSSNSPNMQNIPNKSKLDLLGLSDYNIRSMFLPSAGRNLIISDYSSVELAILAAMSGDERLTYEILHGDVHAFVTNSLIPDKLRAVFDGQLLTKKMAKTDPIAAAIRNQFKRVSFGIVYGSTGYNLYRTLYFDLAAQGIPITRIETDEWVELWKHTLFPQTGALLERNSDYAVTRFYTTSAFGRKRYWSQDIRRDKWRMLAARREGSNHPIQASCADMIKFSMLHTDIELDPQRARLVATVHDELVFEADDAYTEEACGIIKDVMEQSARRLFPDANPLLFTAEPKVSQCYDK